MSKKIKHNEMVKALLKPGAQIQEELTSGDCMLIHMSMGVSGEAGELLDAIKRKTMYRKELDMENVIEELGDIEFYLEGIRQELGLTREECLQANIKKLGERYASGRYSNTQAIARADKQ